MNEPELDKLLFRRLSLTVTVSPTTGLDSSTLSSTARSGKHISGALTLIVYP
ncbi:MAG: hypothetical protein QXK87_05985 [Fervidicoccaceae archaeon]